MEIHFEIENKCLLACRHCSSFASESGSAMQYSHKDIVAFLNKIEDEKEVFLTGGEPLIYPELTSLLKQLKVETDNVILGMFTTGIRERGIQVRSIDEAYAKELYQAGLRVCYLSVYSGQMEEHDWMTSQNGSFTATMMSVQNLKKSGVEIRFNVVVTAKNKDKLFALINMSRVFGVTEVRLLKLLRHGRADNCWNMIGVTDEQYRRTVADILNVNNSVRITASGAKNSIPCRLSCDKYSCPAGRQLWYVTFRGDVYPCASTKNQARYRIGNIAEEDIWKKCKEFSRQLKRSAFCEK